MPRTSSSWSDLAATVVLGFAASTVAAQSSLAQSSLIAPLDNRVPIGVFVSDDRSEEASPIAGSDTELCLSALDDWVRHAEGRISTIAADEDDALIRIYFVAPGAGRYGEMRPILVDGRRGAEVYVRTETDTLGPEIAGAASQDPLLRDTIVYLTCLHEIGHALGMVHTDRFEDVMYFFGFGGDIPGFFNRYRTRLESRADIASESGLSAGDITQLLAAYP